MGALAYVSILLILVFSSGAYFLRRSEYRFGAALFILVAPLQVMALWAVNNQIPFVPRENDAMYYYQFSLREFHDFSDVFRVSDTAATIHDFEGVPYTHLLTVCNQFIGDSLFARKLLNLACLWPAAFAWYWIARQMRGRRYARVVCICMTMLPTLWYFFFILYRDLLTLCFQSTFLAAYLRLCATQRNRVAHTVVCVASFAILTWLRIQTVYFNVLLIVIVWLCLRHMIGVASLLRRNLAILVLGGVCIAAATAVLGHSKLNPQFVAHEVLYYKGAGEIAPDTGWIERAAMMIPLFAVSELGVGASTVKMSDPDNLSAVLNVPWSLAVAPFVLALFLALTWKSTKIVLRRLKSVLSGSGSRVRTRVRRGLDAWRRSVFHVVVAYCVLCYFVCLLTGNWTRWRLPAVPALIMLAILQYRQSSTIWRVLTIAIWIFSVFIYRVAVGTLF
jgi:hypothetical protein